MAGIDALFLDLDETLLDGSNFQETVNQTCVVISHEIPSLSSIQILDANSYVFSSYGMASLEDWTLGRLSGDSLSKEIWQRTLLHCGIGDESVALHAARTHQRFARDSYKLFDDVLPLVNAAASAGIPMVLVTNGASDTQREKLDALNATGWFECLLISGELGHAKPNPLIFSGALAELDVQGAVVWHVGDNLRTDVEGAKSAGLIGVWLNRSGSYNNSEVKPDLEIQTLSEIHPFLNTE